jgi:hypothetical protein
MSVTVDISVNVRGGEPLTLAQAKEVLVKLAIELVDDKKLNAMAQMLVDASAAPRVPEARQRHRAKARRT